MHIHSKPILRLALSAVVVLLVATATGRARVDGCQLETVKAHAYKACDFIGDRLYDDHQRGLARRSRRHARSSAFVEEQDATTRGHHNFTLRYQRPTHLSIENLPGGYLVTAFEYARILHRHPSHRFRIMRTHYRNHNGTLERVRHVEHHHVEHDEHDEHDDDVVVSSGERAASSPLHRRRHQHLHPRANHRHHPTTTTTTTNGDDDAELSNDVAVAVATHQRRRRNANVAVSSCCRDIEQCMHLMCPL